jgi:hypothetical protein
MVNRYSCAEDGLRRPRRGRRLPSEARPVGRIHGGGNAVAGVAGVRVAGAVLDHSDPFMRERFLLGSVAFQVERSPGAEPGLSKQVPCQGVAGVWGVHMRSKIHILTKMKAYVPRGQRRTHNGDRT